MHLGDTWKSQEIKATKCDQDGHRPHDWLYFFSGHPVSFACSLFHAYFLPIYDLCNAFYSRWWAVVMVTSLADMQSCGLTPRRFISILKMDPEYEGCKWRECYGELCTWGKLYYVWVMDEPFCTALAYSHFFLNTGMCRFYCSICWCCPIQWSWDWCRNKGMKNFICEFCVIWFTSDCKFAERIEAVYAGRSINFKDFSWRFLDYGDGWRKMEVGSDSVGTLQKFIHLFSIKKSLLIYEPHL